MHVRPRLCEAAAKAAGAAAKEAAAGTLATEGGLELELQGGLDLSATYKQLLTRLFAGCSHAVVCPMHGGLSGSLVLTADTYSSTGQRESQARGTPRPDANSCIRTHSVEIALARVALAVLVLHLAFRCVD